MSPLHTAQSQLFDVASALPDGLEYRPDFVDKAEEQALLAIAGSLPVRQARFKEYTARRRVYVYGSRFDHDQHTLTPAAIDHLPAPLVALRAKLAAWAGVSPEDFVHVLISEYQPGTPLGWHRDAPAYELVVGVSLGGAARFRLRPWPPDAASRSRAIAIDLAPRCAYLMRGVARWGWQHSVSPVPALRYSVTMRTARRNGSNVSTNSLTR